MDFPKSVPGVGLVGDRFVDENPVTGTTGSLVPAAWGNSVTDEILGVLAEAAVAPDEANHGQLRASILIIALNVLRSVSGKATELVRGALRIGTQAEVDAGVLDDVAVTPKTLRWGFVASLLPSGYIIFPSWLSGFVIQWGQIAFTAGVSNVSFPIAFPGAVFVVLVSDASAAGSVNYAGADAPSLNGFTARSSLSSDTGAARYIALGRA